MTRPAPLVLAVLAAVLSACVNEREVALVAEIAKLKEERVEKTVVEKGREETAAAEAALAATKVEVEEINEEVARRDAERDEIKKAFEAASARNGALVGAIEAVASRAQETAARGQQLDGEVARARAGADFVRSQADLLAREIRPDDPRWATERRLASLADFVQRVAKEHPGDPLLSELAATSIEPKSATPETASALAARLRDRFVYVYALEPPDVAAAEAASGENEAAQ